MRMTRVVMAVLLAFAVFTATEAFAAGPQHDKKGMMMENMKDHHKMMSDMMGMFKETMGIVKGLNHTPTAAQKKRLAEMMDSMDGMMKKHDEMMKMKMKMHDGMKMHEGMMKHEGMTNK